MPLVDEKLALLATSCRGVGKFTSDGRYERPQVVAYRKIP